jgi:hypothetical protein
MSKEVLGKRTPKFGRTDVFTAVKIALDAFYNTYTLIYTYTVYHSMYIVT